MTTTNYEIESKLIPCLSVMLVTKKLFESLQIKYQHAFQCFMQLGDKEQNKEAIELFKDALEDHSILIHGYQQKLEIVHNEHFTKVHEDHIDDIKEEDFEADYDDITDDGSKNVTEKAFDTVHQDTVLFHLGNDSTSNIDKYYDYHVKKENNDNENSLVNYLSNNSSKIRSVHESKHEAKNDQGQDEDSLCDKKRTKNNTGKKKFHQCSPTTQQSLNRHESIDSNKNGLRCDMCKETFCIKKEFKIHMLTHLNNKLLECEDYKKVILPNLELNDHSRMKGEKKTEIKCKQCDKSFYSKSNLNKHMRTHTGERPFKCEICWKDYAYQENLKIHMTTHTGDKPYHCDQCGSRFNMKQSLVKHMVTHSDEKPFQCEVCSKSFRLKSTLRKHQMIHSGERPFRCDQCGWAFRFLENLRSHMKIHSGDKSYNCNQCDKSFYSKSGLSEHIKSHTRIKSFECDICNKMFAKEEQRKRHQIVHSGVKLFNCLLCGKDFARKFQLMRHTDRVHKKKNEKTGLLIV